MKKPEIIFECLSTHIGVLKMQDIINKNALTPSFVEVLLDHLYKIKNNPDLKVLVLAGLPDVFCSGADQLTLTNLSQGKIKPTDIWLPKILLDLPIPVIAAMEGHAVGGGFALGLCADIILIAQSSRYGCSFMNMGFTPGMSTTRLLENVLSPAIAHELQYTGELKRGSEFISKSGFNEILPKAQVFSKTLDIARRIEEKPRLSLELLKRSLSLSKRRCFEETITLETMMHQICFSQQDMLKKIEEDYVDCS